MSKIINTQTYRRLLTGWIDGVRLSSLPEDEQDSAISMAQAAPALYEALKAWEKVDSEMKDNNPCPDLALRAEYRKQARMLTATALALVDGEQP